MRVTVDSQRVQQSSGQCPKCRYPRELDAAACAACGVIFAKLQAIADQRAAPQPDSSAGAPATPAPSSSATAAALPDVWDGPEPTATRGPVGAPGTSSHRNPYAVSPSAFTARSAPSFQDVDPRAWLTPPRALTWVSRFYVILSGLTLPLLAFALRFSPPESEERTSMLYGELIGALVSLVVGSQLIRRQSWVRIAMLVLSAISLFAPPFGTALGAACLFFFSSAGAKLYYSERAAESLDRDEIGALQAWHQSSSGHWMIRLIVIISIFLVLAVILIAFLSALLIGSLQGMK